MAFRQYCMRMIDQEPVVALSTAIGFIAFVTPVVVIPIRQSLGYSNSQYLGEGGGDFGPLVERSVGAGLGGAAAPLWQKGTIGERPSLIGADDDDE